MLLSIPPLTWATLKGSVFLSFPLWRKQVKLTNLTMLLYNKPTELS